MRRIASLVFLLFSSTSIVLSQITDKTVIPSPTAASLGLYGQIPVDLFTGTPNISIPVYNYRSRDLSVPISLTYHPANIKPSDHASWVGLGWSLQAGGLITRVQNDLPDEFIDYATGGQPVQRGFFYNYNTLQPANWNTWNPSGPAAPMNTAIAAFENRWTAGNSNVAHQTVDYAPDEFQFNFLGMSGSFMLGQDDAWHLISKQGLNFTVTTEIGPYAVWEPNINTGSNIKNTPSMVRTCLTRFILTGADGTKYYFGTDPAVNTYNFSITSSTNKYFNTPDSAAVEFCRVGVGYGDNSARDGGTVPVTWYLTEIQSANGDLITFRYTRDGPQILINTNTFGSSSYCPACGQGAYWISSAGDNVTVLDGVSLSSITGANGSITFNKSAANILDYTFLGDPTSPLNLSWFNGPQISGLENAYSYEIFQGISSNGPPGVKSVFMELDKININDNNNNLLKSFKLGYTSGVNNRLFLNSVTESGSDGSNLSPYLLSYNNIAGLSQIPYNTVQVDHWGYYTNVDPFYNIFTATGYEPTYGNPISGNPAFSFYTRTQTNYPFANTFNSLFNAQYITNRNPVSGPSSYGILTQMTYPTGGNTQFVWETNLYSKYINGTFTPAAGGSGNSSLVFSTTDQGSNSAGPGSRIRQIISQANFNSPAVTKTYTYYRDYVHNNYTSSGVLNSGLPTYVGLYTYSSSYVYETFSNYDFSVPHYTDGAPVTYTNVQESNSDGSLKTYTYANHDNGYIDKPGSNYVTTLISSLTPITQTLDLNSLQLARGLLLSEKMYATGSLLLDSITRTYNFDSTLTGIRSYSYSKKFSLDGKVISFDENGFLQVSSGGPLYWGDVTSALNTYYYYPYLKSVTDVHFDQNGLNPLTTTKGYTYDVHRNTKSEVANTSTNLNLTTNYNYLGDAISGLSPTALAATTPMANLSMYGIPLERFVTKGTTQQLHTRLDYQGFTNGNPIIVPYSTWSAISNNNLENETQYVNFDSKGNLLEFIPRNGLTTSFQWGYNQSFPTVKVVNAANTLINYTVPTQTTGSTSASWAAGVFTGQYLTINQGAVGNISIGFGMSSYLSGANVNCNYTVTGPLNQSGILCSNTNGTCSYPSNVTFSNMPVGTYFVSLSVSSNYSVGSSASVSYQTIIQTPVTTGITEFFFDGFEENSNSNVVTGSAHSGNKYWNGSSYTTTYTLPNSRNYIIQWWNLTGGIWKFNQQAYTGVVTLTGPVDDIRIFPSDAQMTSYTFAPLIGVTSETDPTGKATVYQYDPYMRLKTVRDQNNNILKQYDYEFQVLAKPVFNQPQSGVFTKSNCPGGYNGLPITYTVPANIYSSIIGIPDANQKALNDVAANGQNNANAQPVATGCVFAPTNAVINIQNNTATTGCTVKFTNTSTGIVYTLALPSAGGTLTLPFGTYNLTVTTTKLWGIIAQFCTPFGSTSGKTLTINGLSVTPTGCMILIIDTYA